MSNVNSDDRVGWLGPTEIAERVGVSRRCVYNWLRDGKLRYERVIGGPIRIDPSSVWADDNGPRTPWIVDERRSRSAKIGARKAARARRFIA